MKLLNLLVLSFLFVSSFAYSDIISDLKTKKNNTQKQGITYSVVLNNNKEEKAIITEKGNNKLVKYYDMYNFSYLFENGKVYSVPDQWQQFDKNSPIMITLISSVKEMDKDFEKYEIPNYSEYKVVRKETVNGYPCQVLHKIISSEDLEDEMGATFNKQEISRIYVNEKNGYPVKIITFVRSKYKNEKNYTDHDDKDSLNAEMVLSDFSTNLSGKMLTLPKNAYIIDPSNPSSVDPKALLQLQKQLDDDYNEEE